MQEASKQSKRNQLFSSTMVIVLSGQMHTLKQLSFLKIKEKAVTLKIKKMEKIEVSSGGNYKSKSEANSYMSINDFKPINNNYSSVKIYDGDMMEVVNYQTKKEQVLNHIMH